MYLTVVDGLTTVKQQLINANQQLTNVNKSLTNTNQQLTNKNESLTNANQEILASDAGALWNNNARLKDENARLNAELVFAVNVNTFLMLQVENAFKYIVLPEYTPGEPYMKHFQVILSLTYMQINQMFISADSDNDGFVTFKDIAGGIPGDEGLLRNRFSKCDSNGDGKLSLLEFAGPPPPAA